MDQFHVTKLVGKDYMFRRKREMLQTLVPKLDPSVCAKCKLRVFLECKDMPNDELPKIEKTQI